MNSSRVVVVVGAGVIGAAVAWRARQAGFHVTLLDKGEPGAGASAAAAGILGVTAEEPPAALAPLFAASLRMYPAFAAELHALTGTDVRLAFGGLLLLPRDDAHRAALSQRLREDPTATWVQGRALQDLEPGLSPALAERGAFHCTADGRVHPLLLTRALLDACRRSGVDVVPHAAVSRLVSSGGRVTGVRTATGEEHPADAVVLAAGAWSSGLEGAGLPAGSVRPVRGQMLELRTAAAPRHVLYRDHRYVVPRGEGEVVVGSTMEDVGFDARVTPEALDMLHATAADLVPALRDASVASSWAGLRPAAVDGLPLVGRGHLDGLLVATAHFRNGILLCPVTASRVVQMLSGAAAQGDVAVLQPMRLRPSA